MDALNVVAYLNYHWCVVLGPTYDHLHLYGAKLKLDQCQHTNITWFRMLQPFSKVGTTIYCYIYLKGIFLFTFGNFLAFNFFLFIVLSFVWCVDNTHTRQVQCLQCVLKFLRPIGFSDFRLISGHLTKQCISLVKSRHV